MKRHLLVGAICGLAIGTAAAFTTGVRYRSMAVVRLVPPAFSPSLVPFASAEIVEEQVDSLWLSVLSRHHLANLVQVSALYSYEQARYPMETVVDRMRREWIEVKKIRSATQLAAYQIFFQHNDPRLAQSVTQQLASGILQSYTRFLAECNGQTALYWADARKRAAEGWEAARAAPGAGSRKTAAVEHARHNLEQTIRNSQTAALIDEFDKRQQGWTLELLDPASLPTQPETRRWWLIPFGLGAGLATGAMSGWFASRRRRREPAIPGDAVYAS